MEEAYIYTGLKLGQTQAIIIFKDSGLEVYSDISGLLVLVKTPISNYLLYKNH